MKLTTGFDFQGYFITEYLDVIFDEMLVGIGLGRAITSSIDNWLSSLTGGEATEMVDKLNDAKSNLRQRVISKASRLGANALIGIDFESSRLGNLILVSMTATAVKIDKIIEPLPITEEQSKREQLEKELEEKNRIEAEKKQKRAQERQEKIARGETVEVVNKEELLCRINKLDTIEEVLAEIEAAISTDECLLSETQIKELEDCKSYAKYYGKQVGLNSIKKLLASYLNAPNGSEFMNNSL